MDAEVILPAYQEPHFHLETVDTPVGLEITVDVPTTTFPVAIIWPAEAQGAIAIGQTLEGL